MGVLGEEEEGHAHIIMMKVSCVLVTLMILHVNGRMTSHGGSKESAWGPMGPKPMGIFTGAEFAKIVKNEMINPGCPACDEEQSNMLFCRSSCLREKTRCKRDCDFMNMVGCIATCFNNYVQCCSR